MASYEGACRKNNNFRKETAGTLLKTVHPQVDKKGRRTRQDKSAIGSEMQKGFLHSKKKNRGSKQEKLVFQDVWKRNEREEKTKKRITTSKEGKYTRRLFIEAQNKIFFQAKNCLVSRPFPPQRQGLEKTGICSAFVSMKAEDLVFWKNVERDFFDTSMGPTYEFSCDCLSDSDCEAVRYHDESTTVESVDPDIVIPRYWTITLRELTTDDSVGMTIAKTILQREISRSERERLKATEQPKESDPLHWVHHLMMLLLPGPHDFQRNLDSVRHVRAELRWRLLKLFQGNVFVLADRYILLDLLHQWGSTDEQTCYADACAEIVFRHPERWSSVWGQTGTVLQEDEVRAVLDLVCCEFLREIFIGLLHMEGEEALCANGSLEGAMSCVRNRRVLGRIFANENAITFLSWAAQYNIPAIPASLSSTCTDLLEQRFLALQDLSFVSYALINEGPPQLHDELSVVQWMKKLCHDLPPTLVETLQLKIERLERWKGATEAVQKLPEDDVLRWETKQHSKAMKVEWSKLRTMVVEQVDFVLRLYLFETKHLPEDEVRTRKWTKEELSLALYLGEQKPSLLCWLIHTIPSDAFIKHELSILHICIRSSRQAWDVGKERAQNLPELWTLRDDMGRPLAVSALFHEGATDRLVELFKEWQRNDNAGMFVKLCSQTDKWNRNVLHYCALSSAELCRTVEHIVHSTPAQCYFEHKDCLNESASSYSVKFKRIN